MMTLNESRKQEHKPSAKSDIVLMRYDVRRSKVHLINKLSRQAKLWKNKKGTEEQIKKNQYKAERMIKEISVINQLDEDDISKFALNTPTEELQEIKNDTKLLLATHAMAKLALYKFVAASVEAFRTKHPDWQQVLSSLLKKLNKSKKKKQVNNGKTSKPVVNSSHKPTFSGKENMDGNDTNKSLEMDNFSEGYESDNEKYAKEMNSSEERFPCSKKIKKDGVSKTSEDETNDRLNSNVTHSTNSSHAMQSGKIKNENVNGESDTENENKQSDKMRAVDPFFITMENTEYITTQIPKLEKFENIKTDSFLNRKYGSDDIRLQDKNTSKENWKHFKSKNSLLNQSYKHDNIPSNSCQSSKRKLNSKVHSSASMHHTMLAHQSSGHEPPAKQEKLHPSWEAKKKLSSVAAFEGKKITFDD